MGSDFDKQVSEAEHEANRAPSGLEALIDAYTDKMGNEAGVSNKIVTVPNIISCCRLIFIPIFLVLLLRGHDVAAFLVFAFAALSDCIDGYVARSTGAVSKLGQILDPFVDRLLMISGALGLIAVGRLPVWIVVLVLVRDGLMLLGGSILLRKWSIRIPVIYAGKVVTTLLFAGFAGLLINWPRMTGLGLCQLSWLPGFNGAVCPWGIWLVYAGLVLGVFTTSYYIVKSLRALHEAKSRQVSQFETV